MTFNSDQMQRQTAFELSFSYINTLFDEGTLSRSDYESELKILEEKYHPVVLHNSLLYKEKE